MFYKYNFYFY